MGRDAADYALLLVPFLCGLALIVQNGISASVSALVGHGLPASMLSFSGGTLTLAACVLGAALASRSGRGPKILSEPEEGAESEAKPGPEADAPRFHPWLLSGGLIGATIITGTIFLAPAIGFALQFVCIVAGQMGMSLVLDHIGFLGMRRQPLSPAKVAATALLLSGAAMTLIQVFTSDDAGGSVSRGAQVVLAIAAMCVGSLMPLQALINGRARKALRSPLLSALMSFSVGATVLLFGSAILWATDDGAWQQAQSGVPDMDWWMFLAGPIGVVYVSSALLLAPKIGVARFFTALVAGQLSSSLVMDDIGAFGLVKRPATALRIAGVVVAFAGAAAVQAVKAGTSSGAADVTGRYGAKVEMGTIEEGEEKA